ncbi:MAG: bacillithiol biosynthesis deacetylase BshB1 [Cyclobacteriaceae bacterium]|nr:bacillithiol biosynthesis deacetylase BshB1 [Cyclobacteriaceae bacterium]
MKLDILVLAAHPDDAELGCGGTILKHIAAGKKVGVIDFTRGELGTRGTALTRDQEASDAARILGLTIRENLNLADGFFVNDQKHQMAVIRMIRKYQPDIVLCNAVHDRHPDHGKGSDLAYESCFFSGLAKIQTQLDGVEQKAWRPKAVYQYIQSEFIVPDFIVDISGTWEKKMEAIRAFKTQFYDPASKEPETYISNPNFTKLLEARAIEFGHAIGVQHGEGFTTRRWVGVKSLYDLL